MKLSKKDQDPQQSLRDKSDLERWMSKKSHHFTNGSYVRVNTRLAEVVSAHRSSPIMFVKYETGEYEIVRNPHFDGHSR